MIDGISEVEHDAKMGIALGKLMSNPDFQLVFLNGYFKEHAAQLVKDLGLNTCVGLIRETKFKQIEAVGYLSSYLDMIGAKGESALASLNDLTEIDLEDQE